VQLDPIVFNELGHSSEIAVAVTAAESVEITGNDAPAGFEFVAVPQTENKYRGPADKSALLHKPIATEGADDFLTFPRKTGLINNAHAKLPFQVVNLRYDLTPLCNISVVATETGLIPPSSVPVLIREIQSDGQDK
jgi:translation initiation factor 2B subunit (eIF-2B alpha/beta/delta family)